MKEDNSTYQRFDAPKACRLPSRSAVASEGARHAQKKYPIFSVLSRRQGQNDANRGQTPARQEKKVKKILSPILLDIRRKAKSVKKKFHLERYFFDFLRLLYSRGLSFAVKADSPQTNN